MHKLSTMKMEKPGSGGLMREALASWAEADFLSIWKGIDTSFQCQLDANLFLRTSTIACPLLRQLVSEGAKHLVERSSAVAIVALEEPDSFV